jgi:hypothetical protein
MAIPFGCGASDGRVWQEKDVGEKRKFQSADEGDPETREKHALENVHWRSPFLPFVPQMIASR